MGKPAPAKQPKKKRGRPATGHQPQRQFRASDAQWAEWQRAAESRGLTRAAWMRDVLDRAANRLIRAPG